MQGAGARHQRVGRVDDGPTRPRLFVREGRGAAWRISSRAALRRVIASADVRPKCGSGHETASDLKEKLAVTQSRYPSSTGQSFAKAALGGKNTAEPVATGRSPAPRSRSSNSRRAQNLASRMTAGSRRPAAVMAVQQLLEREERCESTDKPGKGPERGPRPPPGPPEACGRQRRRVETQLRKRRGEAGAGRAPRR